MDKYYIDYGTGAGNEWAPTVEAAKKIADNGAAYTQRAIVIEDESGQEIARRQWWGVRYDPGETDEKETDIIDFGDFGYFGAWN